MSQENVEIVREAFQAFLEEDVERSAQLVSPEVDFHGTVGGLQEGQTRSSSKAALSLRID
jgi:ketosteroid isomerase-like protein